MINEAVSQQIFCSRHIRGNMKIPEKLKRAIGILDITIEQVDGLTIDSASFGEWNPRLAEIRQDKTLTPQMRTENFWHEIVEAINDNYGAELTHGQIYILGMTIAQVIASLEEAYGKEIGE